MTAPRFYVPQSLAEHTTVVLPGSTAHHAIRVLRLRVGDAVILFIGEGGEYAAVITEIGRSRVGVTVGAPLVIERESPLDVTLIQAISAGERMDTTVQKAVELGVSAIVPVMSERSVVRLQGARADKRIEHWRQIAISACEQCGRNRVPDVRPLFPLNAVLAGERPAAERWVLLPGASKTLRNLARPEKPVEILIGPEGGLTETEAGAAQRAGFMPVQLGPRVLRTETAAPALLAALQALWGDF